ncbi:hypothetical protein PHYPO_G00073720 [Pangasianodon hypophthalmus]|uniref:Uncharacterized protein n=1 Tax=Pangasianodon hypophthalmus TaxID=310915 RepID=A0A5N5LUY0_PANHP|nr:hypothetical protein PHYPO_G00073720 [Pangasianodon hypophthalmus]
MRFWGFNQNSFQNIGFKNSQGHTPRTTNSPSSTIYTQYRSKPSKGTRTDEERTRFLSSRTLSPPSSWVKLGKFLQRLELDTSGSSGSE